jgi:hypothetical protein
MHLPESAGNAEAEFSFRGLRPSASANPFPIFVTSRKSLAVAKNIGLLGTLS